MSLETTTLAKVSKEEEKSWGHIALIQAGVMICVPSLMLGGILIEGMGLGQAILAGTIGYGLATLIMVMMGIQGHDLKVPTVVCSQSSFGVSGSRYIISVLFIASLIGWFALQTNVCGSAFTTLMQECFGVTIPVWMSSVIWGIIMLITAVYGINALTKLNIIAVPALILVSIYGTYKAIQLKGLGGLKSYEPVGEMDLFTGVMLTVGFLVVGAVIAADFTRYQKSRKDTVKSTAYGIMPAGIAMLIMGAIMTLVAGTYDITLVLAEIGIPILGAVILILATWTSNTTNAYSAGIDIVALFNLSDDKRASVTMIAGLIGTVLGSAGIINYFQVFLDLSNYFFIPIAGVMLTDYFIRCKGKAELWNPSEHWNKSGVIAWAVAFLIGLLIPGNLSVIIAFLVAELVYFLMSKYEYNLRIKEVDIQG